jgi:hypothetical protein
MGKGGPLAFLNKKPWHPANARNQEEIWKREQAYLAELEKRDELKRSIEEEREKEDNQTQFQRHKCVPPRASLRISSADANDAAVDNTCRIALILYEWMCRLGEQRVEWMYQGGFAAREDAEKRKEEYLMGKTVDKLPEDIKTEEAARVSVLLKTCLMMYKPLLQSG